ncbi:hypothetical protein ACFL5O_10330 [Myxococcota bacterium]
MVSDDSGVCVACNGTVHGNSCDTCPPDVVLDGATIKLGTHSFNAGTATAGDTCPEVFLVQVNDPAALFSRGAIQFGADVGPSPVTETFCERPYSLQTIRDTASGLVVEPPLTGVGRSNDCDDASSTCIALCSDLPERYLTAAEVTSGMVSFGTDADPNTVLHIVAEAPVDPVP